MALKIKNWKLVILTIVFFSFFIGLGCWQLSRAKQKQLLLDSFASRTKQPFLSAPNLNVKSDWRFYQAALTGVFDNEHTFLLDNKIYQGRVGYEVFTPFYAKKLSLPILIDRGFIPIKRSRQDLPTIKKMVGKFSLTGMLNLPPHYVSLGQWKESPALVWPLRIEYIDLKEMAALLKPSPQKVEPFFPYVLTLDPKNAAAYEIEWQIVTMGPERHRGYAIQWFALALTLLILFVALNWETRSGSR